MPSFDCWLWCVKGLAGVTSFLQELKRTEVPCSEEARRGLESCVERLSELLRQEPQ